MKFLIQVIVNRFLYFQITQAVKRLFWSHRALLVLFEKLARLLQNLRLADGRFARGGVPESW
jgi:hypothetical protein